MAKKKSPHYDMIVIGCGAAGLSAAVSYLNTCRENGKTPNAIVLERADREHRGGATRWTSAWFRITRDRELDPNFIPQMQRISKGLADLDYCKTLAAEVKTTLQFLDDNNVEVIFFEQAFPNTNSGGGLGMPAGGGVSIVTGLAGTIEASKGVNILYETEGLRLSLSKTGDIDGVMVRNSQGRLQTLKGRTVVIASGGFEGNREMLTQYLGGRACDLPVIAPTLVNNRGEGIRMVMDVGGDTAGQFDMFHGEPVDTRTQKPDAVIYGFPYGIVVNQHARRFFDEGQESFDDTFEKIAYEIWKNQDQKAWFIGDQTTLGIPNIDAINLTDQPPVSADSLAGLAAQLGLDPEALEDTVIDFNQSVNDRKFDPLVRDGKATTGIEPPKSNWAFPINTPPYIAYPLTCAITFTFGGIRTDSRGQVMTATNKPIPGLFAAGEVTGLYYHEYPAGTSVLRSATFGRIIGAHIAGLED